MNDELEEARREQAEIERKINDLFSSVERGCCVEIKISVEHAGAHKAHLYRRATKYTHAPCLTHHALVPLKRDILRRSRKRNKRVRQGARPRRVNTVSVEVGTLSGNRMKCQLISDHLHVTGNGLHLLKQCDRYPGKRNSSDRVV